MPSPEKDIAVGLSFTYGTTNIDGRKILDYTLPECIAPLVEQSDQSSTNHLEFVGADLTDAGKFRVVVYHWQDYDYWSEVGQTAALVITTPSGATITCQAVYESYTPQQATLNDRMLAEAVFQLTPGAGEPTVVPVA